MIAKLWVEMDNAAFEGNNGTELARIIRKLADKVDGFALEGDDLFDCVLSDLNGNKVGRFEVIA